MTGKKTNQQQQQMERHEIKVGAEYMYGDHKVKVDYTFWDKYIPGSFALVDDPHLKEKRVVPVSDLSVIVPPVAKLFVQSYLGSKGLDHETYKFVASNKPSLFNFLIDLGLVEDKQQINTAVDYIMKEINS